MSSRRGLRGYLIIDNKSMRLVCNYVITLSMIYTRIVCCYRGTILERLNSLAPDV
jgi:hypothetical protein